jgi:Spy/CpxP family protein refolding chaperone
MRTVGVLVCVAMASVIGGGVGYSVADRARADEATRLLRERDLGSVRERELKVQLEDAFAARAALAQESQRLQEHLSERLKRLEDFANRLTTEQQLREEGRGD